MTQNTATLEHEWTKEVYDEEGNLLEEKQACTEVTVELWNEEPEMGYGYTGYAGDSGWEITSTSGDELDEDEEWELEKYIDSNFGELLDY